MDTSVVIKGNKNGIMVVLDKDIEFSLLKELLAQKFADSAKFLGCVKTAISFEGRELTQEQEIELLEVIKENSNLEVVCVLGRDEQQNAAYINAVNETLMERAGNTAKFYKMNIRSGMTLEKENGIILIGDVNPSGTVISNGSIIILGALRGHAYAGASGNKDAFVFALDMNPQQIRIAEIIARAPDTPDKSSTKDLRDIKEARIAYLEEDNIYIEPVSKQALNDIRISEDK